MGDNIPTNQSDSNNMIAKSSAIALVKKRMAALDIIQKSIHIKASKQMTEFQAQLLRTMQDSIYGQQREFKLLIQEIEAL